MISLQLLFEYNGNFKTAYKTERQSVEEKHLIIVHCDCIANLIFMKVLLAYHLGG